MNIWVRGHIRDVYTINGPTTPAALEMLDDGTNGDRKAGDGIT